MSEFGFNWPGASGKTISDINLPQQVPQGQGQGWLGNILGGLRENPEGFAQIAGRMGAQILGPDHPLSAVGAGAADWGRSRQVNKALEKASNQRASRKEQLLKYLSQALGDNDIPTPGDADGDDDLTFSLGGDGSYKINRKGSFAPKTKTTPDLFRP
jgi:hypothetical protein